ncbi:MAG: twin-arginine translocase TatA/TatE family subunit [Pyrinomonadaceae bacterium]|nr:twin-arginine translocase TatA/TatE family subunit [Pyrinomonadaceae bacterium]
MVALILLGPRKLPQMSRKIGKSLAEFKRTSEDFKRTWEREVDLESSNKDARIERAMLPAENSILDTTVGRGSSSSTSAASEDGSTGNAATENVPAPSVTPIDPSVMQPALTAASSGETPAPTTAAAATTAPTRKRDWL